MMRRSVLIIACLAIITVLASSACKIGREKTPAQAPDVLQEGESLGSIERLPGGTPVSTDVRTLLAVECTNETLVVRTNAESLSAAMPCDRMLPAAIVDQFIGKTVAIKYEGERLKITNESVGGMELPSKEPRIVPADATP